MAKKNKIPKKIFGVKIPKVFRKNALLKGLLASPTGRQLMANALIAAASAAAAVLAGTKSGNKVAHTVVDASEDSSKLLKRAIKSAAGAMTDVIADAAKAAVGDGGRSVEKTRPRVTATH